MNINISGIEWSSLFRKMLLSWLTASLLEYLLLPGDLKSLENLNGLSQMSIGRMICTALILFGYLVVCDCILSSEKVKQMTGQINMENAIWKKRLRQTERWAMWFVYAVFAVAAVSASFTPAFLSVCILILVLLAGYAYFGCEQEKTVFCSLGTEDEKTDLGTGEEKCKEKKKKTKRPWLWLVGILTLLMFALLSFWTVGRVYSFSTPTYDFGIFSQMFYYMKKIGQPLTTVERDGLLSHFCVHVSPIYYLLLPVYCIWPEPAALQVLQAAVVVSSVIPLWKIGKKKGFREGQCALLCMILLAYPAFAGATNYDIHENCFLLPLILWILYGIESGKTKIILLFAILTLMVKEDAAVYVAVIGLWLMVRGLVQKQDLDISVEEADFGQRRKKESTVLKGRKRCLLGVILLLAAIGWFFAVTTYLARIGDGVMTYRYRNFIFDGSGSLLTVIKAVLLNPMKAVFECVDTQKLSFIGMTIGALLGIPLLTRKYDRFILLIPYLLVNLMSDYKYQHDIFYQYTFGATAFLFYLVVLNLADEKKRKRRTWMLGLLLILNLALFCENILPRAVYYGNKAVKYEAYYQEVRDFLSWIPEDASVTAGTYYTTYLSQREILYDIHYSSVEHMLSTDYVVLSKKHKNDYRKFADENGNYGYENLTALLEKEEYEIFDQLRDELVIYYKVEEQS